MIYTISEKSFIGSQWHHVRPRRIYVYLGAAIILMYLAVIGGFSYAAINGKAPNGFAIILAIPMWFILMGFLTVSRWRKTYRQTSMYHGDIQVNRYDGGIKFIYKQGNWRLDYSEIKRISLEESILRLYINDYMYHLVIADNENSLKECEDIVLSYNIKRAQQVDSAEASTIAVPPSDPSGSPR